MFDTVTLTLEFDLFFWKTLTLLITFEQCVLELLYFTWVFFVIRYSVVSFIFDTVNLTLEFDPFF